MLIGVMSSVFGRKKYSELYYANVLCTKFPQISMWQLTKENRCFLGEVKQDQHFKQDTLIKNSIE